MGFFNNYCLSGIKDQLVRLLLFCFYRGGGNTRPVLSLTFHGHIYDSRLGRKSGCSGVALIESGMRLLGVHSVENSWPWFTPPPWILLLEIIAKVEKIRREEMLFQNTAKAEAKLTAPEPNAPLELELEPVRQWWKTGEFWEKLPCKLMYRSAFLGRTKHWKKGVLITMKKTAHFAFSMLPKLFWHFERTESYGGQAYAQCPQYASRVIPPF